MNASRVRFERWLTRRTDRRRLLAGLGASAVAVSLPGSPTRLIVPHRVGAADGYPFALGVASGDPLPDGVVLWTRLAPDPLAPDGLGGMSGEPVEVRWEVATDDGFGEVVASGMATATAELAYAVHVDVAGLEPGREYAYRFLANGEVSPVGRTKTAPAAGAPTDRLRFGFASCANWEHGYFSAYRHLADEEIDLVLFLGDYLYEYEPGRDYRENATPVRLHAGAGEITTLTDYRLRHAQYKTDSDLQAAHARCPWVATWDDHEVENNYAGDHSADGAATEAFLARRAAAYQAYYEHLPLRPESMPHGPELRLYRRLAFGDLAEISVLDTRQYRSDQPCGDTVAPRCEVALDPALTMTGPDQERWLLEGLSASTARWNVIAQQVMMGELAIRFGAAGPQFNDDQWDGYPLARNRILGHIAQAGVENAVVLTGDVHSAWVHDLKADFLDEASPVVATEFVASSITADNPFGAQLALLLGGNPHITFFDAHHGYTLCDLTPDRWQTDFRAMPDTTAPDASVETIASFVVEAGKAGVVKG